jgi:hypothetical protein
VALQRPANFEFFSQSPVQLTVHRVNLSFLFKFSKKIYNNGVEEHRPTTWDPMILTLYTNQSNGNEKSGGFCGALAGFFLKFFEKTRLELQPEISEFWDHFKNWQPQKRNAVDWPTIP